MKAGQHPIARLLANPVTTRELRGRMRGGRTFIVLTGYLALLSAAAGLVLIAFAASNDATTSATSRQVLGKSVFGVVVGMQLLIVCFVAPALTSGAISAERESQTYDLLRTTLLPARSLVFGKLGATMAFLLLLLFASLPLLSLSYLFGGIALEEIAISLIMLLVTTLAFSCLGLFFSSFTRRTLISTVLSYTLTLLLVFGIPILLLFGTSLFGATLSNVGSRMNLISEVILISSGIALVSINPIASAIVTEVILINEQSAYYYQLPLSNGSIYPVLSPWITYSIVYLSASLILLWITIRIVRKAER